MHIGDIAFCSLFKNRTCFISSCSLPGMIQTFQKGLTLETNLLLGSKLEFARMSKFFSLSIVPIEKAGRNEIDRIAVPYVDPFMLK